MLGRQGWCRGCRSVPVICLGGTSFLSWPPYHVPCQAVILCGGSEMEFLAELILIVLQSPCRTRLGICLPAPPEGQWKLRHTAGAGQAGTPREVPMMVARVLDVLAVRFRTEPELPNWREPLAGLGAVPETCAEPVLPLDGGLPVRAADGVCLGSGG